MTGLEIGSTLSGTVRVHDGDYNENLLISRPATIDGNYTGTVARLTGTGAGSAVVVTGTTGVTIDGLHISGGKASGLGHSTGGGVSVHLGTALVSSSVITGNEATSGGGVACGPGSKLTVTNSVIAYNNSTATGGGAVGRTVTVFNSIVYSNSLSSGAPIDIAPACTVAFSYTTSPTAGTGNRDPSYGSPLMTDPANGDFSLQPGSACVDVGAPSLSPTSTITAPPGDITGAPRPAHEKPRTAIRAPDSTGPECRLHRVPWVGPSDGPHGCRLHVPHHAGVCRPDCGGGGNQPA